MKDKFKSMLRKVGAAALEPTLEKMLTDRLSMASRPEQIQLALKFRETVNAQGKGMSFEDVGFNVFSPTWEDGILLYIFSLIGFGSRKCVDIGAGQVYGSNVANLIVNHGFTGFLADGSSRNIEINRQFYSSHLETKLFMPKLLSTFITAENVNGLLRDNGFSGEIDLLSLDIDGIDYWIWKAMDAVSPRVVVVEYQDLLGPDRAWTVPYRPDFDAHSFPVNEKQYNYCGASLRAFTNLAKEKGYRLVGCSRGGWNAFFVRDGLGESFLPEVTVESCFRYEWNHASMETRFPLVKDMEWVEV